MLLETLVSGVLLSLVVILVILRFHLIVTKVIQNNMCRVRSFVQMITLKIGDIQLLYRAGGPLITKVKDKWVQLGIVSWGAEDPDESSFDVNTDVSYFKSWIQSVLNK